LYCSVCVFVPWRIPYPIPSACSDGHFHRSTFLMVSDYLIPKMSLRHLFTRTWTYMHDAVFLQVSNPHRGTDSTLVLNILILVLYRYRYTCIPYDILPYQFLENWEPVFNGNVYPHKHIYLSFVSTDKSIVHPFYLKNI
jgi:hypothetical protein